MVALALCCAVSVYAQDNLLDAATERRLKDYFLDYKLDAATGYAQARMKSYRIDNRLMSKGRDTLRTQALPL